MSMTINGDGTVTYAVTVPNPINVGVVGNTYQAGSAAYIVSNPTAELPALRTAAAASIAILDQIAADDEAHKAAARDRLGAALYADAVKDNATAPAWTSLTTTDQQPYLDQAGSLGARGVSAAAS